MFGTDLSDSFVFILGNELHGEEHFQQAHTVSIRGIVDVFLIHIYTSHSKNKRLGVRLKQFGKPRTVCCFDIHILISKGFGDFCNCVGVSSQAADVRDNEQLGVFAFHVGEDILHYSRHFL